MKNEEGRMKNAAIMREQSDACISYAKQMLYQRSLIDI